MQTLDFEVLKRKMTIEIGYFLRNCPEFNPKGKRGGCLVLADKYGNELYHAPVGENIDDYEKYHQTALRKIRQLVDNPQDLTSYPSRNPDKGLWGGGIRLFDDGLVAFSGLPELADEACLLSALVECGYYPDMNFLLQALALSENRIYERLH